MYFLRKFRLRWFVNVVYMGTSGEGDMTFCGCDHFSRVNSRPQVDLHFYRDLEQYLTHLEHQILY